MVAGCRPGARSCDPQLHPPDLQVQGDHRRDERHRHHLLPPERRCRCRRGLRPADPVRRRPVGALRDGRPQMAGHPGRGDHRRPLPLLLRGAPRPRAGRPRAGPASRWRAVDRSAVYLADEQEADLDRQEWILMAERRPVAQIRREAKNAGLPADRIARILPDEADDTQVGSGQEDEVESGGGQMHQPADAPPRPPTGCGSAAPPGRWSTAPEQCIPGLRHYPLCGMRWEERQGSARGGRGGRPADPQPDRGQPHPRPPGRSASSGSASRPPSTIRTGWTNPDALGRVGASLKVKNLAGQPPLGAGAVPHPGGGSGPTPPRCRASWSPSPASWRGASDAATGQVDPTRASGEAIKAAPRPERAGPQRADRRLPRDDRAAGPDLAGAVGGLRRRGAGRPAAGGGRPG